jgi:mRNA interferase MazF
MTEYSRGDVVLVRYQASAEDETWLRPAVVVSSETYHQGRGQLLLAAVTSSERSLEPGDTVVQGWREAGLLGASLVTGVLLTVEPEAIERRLGVLGEQDAHGVESSLRLSLGV